jgi:hypothetical protein
MRTRATIAAAPASRRRRPRARAHATAIDAEATPATPATPAPAAAPKLETVETRAETPLDAPAATNLVDDARFEPIRRAADQVTLQFQGEGGLEGRVRIALRGEAVHASILSSDAGTLARFAGEAGSLKRALDDQGFSNARITVHDLRTGGPAHASLAQGPARGENDRRQGEPQRRSGQGRDARQNGDSAKERRSSREERRSE